VIQGYHTMLSSYMCMKPMAYVSRAATLVTTALLSGIW
jgi:hypothetical protein